MELSEFPAEWNIEALERLADGIGGTVWKARRRAGPVVIVKRVSDLAAAEASSGVSYLRWRDGLGAIRLVDERERLQLQEFAGDRSLLDVLRDDGDAAATHVAAAVIRQLHAESSGPAPRLPTLRQRFQSLFLKADKPDAGEMAALFKEAADVAERLLARQPFARPLHGDIHHGNILESERGWIAIDPHGVSGDPAYEAANMLYNPVEQQHLRTDPARLAAMAEVLSTAVGRPAETIIAFGFVHACLSASWHDEDGNADESRRSLEAALACRALLS